MNELITISGDMAILNPETAAKVAEFERLAKEVKAKEDELKKRILAEMEAKSVIKLDTGSLLISYVAPTTREVLDTKALKEECPDIFDTYVKLSPTKAGLRIKVR